MIQWVLILGGIYLLLLVLASTRSFKRNRSLDEFMFAGSNIGPLLGVLTFAAALFSAFTFLGMPDFFKVHGVGAWIFLAFSDGVMVFFMIWFGYKIRMKAKKLGFKGVAGLIQTVYQLKIAGLLMFTSAFIFLIPYVAIQIRGISIFLNATFPDTLPIWSWSVLIVVIMLVYSEIGGFKAIVYSDAIQGILLLSVIWIIGISCILYFGNVKNLFDAVHNIDKQLLSTPGPKGLFSPQFLIGSMIAIVLIPVTQPQFTTRLMVMKNIKSLYRMAVSIGVFAILVIFPTIFIGMYGAVKYSASDTSEFLSSALLFDQVGIVAALAVIGLFAACLSTTNAQLFALGSELRSLLSGTEKQVFLKTKIGIFIFAVIVLLFSTVMSDELALLARTSFTGTSMMAPIVLSAVICKGSPGKEILFASGFAFIVFLLSLFGLIPQELGKMKLDILLYIFLAIITAVSIIIRRNNRIT